MTVELTAQRETEEKIRITKIGHVGKKKYEITLKAGF